MSDVHNRIQASRASLASDVVIGANSIVRADEVVLGKSVRIAENVDITCDRLELHDGCSIGANTTILSPEVVLGPGCVLGGALHAELNEYLRMGRCSVIAERVRIVGQGLQSGEFLWVESDVLIGGGGARGPRSYLTAGDRTSIFARCYVNLSEQVRLGSCTALSYGVVVLTHGAWQPALMGYATRFLALTLIHSGLSFRRFRLTVKEMFFSGVMSIIIIVVAGMFVGMVLGLQGYETLKRYGSESALGTLVALSLVRELGPVLAALLFASRAGSAMTAGIGLMKATEQIAAMEMMAVNPIARLIAPRFWAGVFSMPLLASIFSVMGIFGGYVVGVVIIGVDEGSFWSQMQESVDFQHDIMNGFIKSIVFGVAVTVIALFEGFDAPPTAEGVAGATTRTVVQSSLAILFLDFILTAFMFRGD